MSLTSPLGLMRHVRRPNLRMEVVPWLNVLALGWLMTLLSSNYIYAPGLAVGLTAPDSSLPQHLALTEITGQPSLLHIDRTLTIMLPYYYLEDGRHYRADLPKALSDFVKSANRKHLVLLVKMNSDVTAQTFADVCEVARAAGFETVQQAVIPVSDQNSAASASSASVPSSP